MNILVSLLAAAAWAGTVPDPAALLRRATYAPAVGYEGRVVEVRWRGRQARSAEVDIAYRDGMTRREVRPRAAADARLFISDGRLEWVVAPGRRTAVRRPAVDWAGRAALLARNYRARLEGEERVAGRTAWALGLEPAVDGKPRQRLWIDAETGLILRSRQYRADGAPASESNFVRVTIPARPSRAAFRFDPPPDYRVEALESPAVPRSGEPFPPELAGGFVFEGARTLRLAAVPLRQGRYSDGLVTVSLFESGSPVRLRELRGAAPEGRAQGAVVQWRMDKRQYILMGDVSERLLREMARGLKASQR